MKYIRTKDNRIYELSNGVDFKKTKETYVWCYDKRFNTHFKVDVKNILKQAETIEELCDMLVVKYKNDLPRPQLISELKKSMELANITWEEHFSWLFKRFKEKLEWVKLAVYTDKGLIYVAKMNDKGELELL